MEAVRALDYHPNYSGQVLRGKATRQILFFCPHLYNPFYVHVYYGMDDYAQQHDYSIVLSRHFDCEAIRGGRYDGFVVSINDSITHKQPIQFLDGIHARYIAAAFLAPKSHLPYVGFDIEQSADLAVRHLYELGHRDIMYISDAAIDDGKWHHISRAIERFPFLHCEYLALNPAPELYDNLYEVGYLYAMRVYRMIKLPTAVIAANDALATGLLAGLQEKGMRIPEDISVIGFDDTFLSRFTSPSLTTIHFPKYEMGQTLMKGLLSILDNKPFDTTMLPSRLIVRSTTAAPRSQ